MTLTAGVDYTPYHPELAYTGPHDKQHVASRAFNRKEIVQVDIRWHKLARDRDATLGPNRYSRGRAAELDSEQDFLLQREVGWLRIAQLPTLAYMWKKKSGFCFAQCDAHDADNTVVIERYQRLWVCLGQEAESTAPRGQKYGDYDQLADTLRPVLLKHRMAQMAATNDLYAELQFPSIQWLDRGILEWLLDGQGSPLTSLEQKMCLIAEIQRFRDASYSIAEGDDYQLGKMAKEWFRGIFTLPSGQLTLQKAYDFVDDWVESLEDMEDNRGGVRMSAAMWLHERQTNGRYKMPEPLLLRQ
ncbi:hypothetical protein PENSPDRAFT_682077 [Peniophora sp. CONT]|nr:hypothetical protein PENSPDRAFT_682077 [Peniophora sp. CONT]